MLPLFILAIFSGASLLFLVQPMIAKQVLPLLGGSPAVWNTCMLFFQVALLGGYLYAHLLSKIANRRAQLIAHGVVVLIALVTLPIGLSEGAGPAEDSDPTTWLLGALLSSVGGPFFILATASPLLQSWFAGTDHRSAKDPYFLYAASNAGSMLALLGYPFWLEPAMELPTQLLTWSVGFGAFAVLALSCGWLASRRSETATEAGTATTAATSIAPGRVTWLRRLHWIALAFVPSSLMLGATQHIATDVATTPLLWVLPLALYLLTFIVVFTRGGRSVTIAANALVPFVVIVLGGLILAQQSTPMIPQIAAHLIGLFVICSSCHGQLAMDRPGPGRLTEFYLLMSIGGALGGSFNALVAPLVFDWIAEYPVVLVLACLLRIRRAPATPKARPRLLQTAVSIPIAIGFVLGAYLLRHQLATDAWVPDEILGFDGKFFVHGFLPAVACVLFLPWRVAFPFALAAMFACTQLSWHDVAIHKERTFFGMHRVTRYQDGKGHWTQLFHGTTSHGIQYSIEPWSKYTTTYYTKSGPAGDIAAVLMENDAEQHIALVGLGVGTLARYGRYDWKMTCYEIDPAVVRIARDEKYFTYLRDSNAKLDFVIGDARQRIAQTDDQYDAIFLDAFSSDAIPIHLITKEAIELYLSHLKPDGMLAFHITNWHLNLVPVLSTIAQDLNLVAAIRRDGDRTQEDLALTKKAISVWVVLTRSQKALGAINFSETWKALPAERTKRIWTDNYSNVWEILR